MSMSSVVVLQAPSGICLRVFGLSPRAIGFGFELGSLSRPSVSHDHWRIPQRGIEYHQKMGQYNASTQECPLRTMM